MDDGSCVSGGESLTQCEEYHNEVATNTENIRLTLSNINKKLVCRRNVENIKSELSNKNCSNFRHTSK